MEWTRVTSNWTRASKRLETRFPHLNPGSLQQPPSHLDEMARIVADSHDLTLAEAHHELRDLLFPEMLPEPIARAVV